MDRPLLAQRLLKYNPNRPGMMTEVTEAGQGVSLLGQARFVLVCVCYYVCLFVVVNDSACSRLWGKTRPKPKQMLMSLNLYL